MQGVRQLVVAVDVLLCESEGGWKRLDWRPKGD